MENFGNCLHLEWGDACARYPPQIFSAPSSNIATSQHPHLIDQYHAPSTFEETSGNILTVARRHPHKNFLRQMTFESSLAYQEDGVFSQVNHDSPANNHSQTQHQPAQISVRKRALKTPAISTKSWTPLEPRMRQLYVQEGSLSRNCERL